MHIHENSLVLQLGFHKLFSQVIVEKYVVLYSN